jgi:hypothetical protein
MSHHWLEHTAELELQLDAASETGVFREALEALGELIGDGAFGKAVSGSWPRGRRRGARRGPR